jgi:hypothetical protein
MSNQERSRVLTGRDLAHALRYTMTVADVARVLGVGADRVRQLDELLKPTRAGANQRRYDPAQVRKALSVRGRSGAVR